MDSQCTLVGNLTRDPELRYTTGGTATVSVGIAINRRRKNAAGEWEDDEPSFFTLVCWRDMAENVAASLTKGTRVVATGDMRQRSYEGRDGEKRT